MKLAPIALFAYNRLWHIQQTIESLKNNPLAKDSELFIFSDAAKDEKSADSVIAVRDYLKTIGGFKKVHVNELKENLGLSVNIITGVRDIVGKHGKIVVLEDDLCISRHFLNFMNDALLFYENEPRVISISGYMYPVRTKGRETLFLRIPDCWGWATWKRGWDLFEPDANRLLEQLKSRKMVGKFNLNGGYDFFKMLKKQSKNEISSWAIRGYASALLKDKLSLYPAKSLVRNIGFGDSGTHDSYGAGYDVGVYQGRVIVSEIPLEEDRHVIGRVGMLFRMNKFKKLWHIIRKATSSIFR